MIVTLDEECTNGYSGFMVAANVKLDGKQQWVDGSAAFQLRLTDGHKLALRSKAAPYAPQH